MFSPNVSTEDEIGMRLLGRAQYTEYVSEWDVRLPSKFDVRSGPGAHLPRTPLNAQHLPTLTPPHLWQRLLQH